jgi:hypothetical protein
MQEMAAAGQLRLLGQAGGGYLVELVKFRAVDFGNVLYHVTKVLDAARERDLRRQLHQTLQRLEAPGVELLTVMREHREEVEALEVVTAASVDLGLTDFADFMAEPDEPVDFVVPFRLARGEKVVITGGEGLGKSTIFRQIALCVAAGLDPFTFELCEPKRVLWLDAENPKGRNRRKMRPIYEQILRQGRDIHRGYMTLEHLRGFNLLDDHDVAWATRAVTEAQPDLIFIGPLYRILHGSWSDEERAAPAIDVLNRLCDISGAAMMLEAHAGHGKGPDGKRDWRPRGSSVLLGWPDFGFGLAVAEDAEGFGEFERVVDVHDWRGQRETDRAWPVQLTSGTRFPWDGHSR